MPLSDQTAETAKQLQQLLIESSPLIEEYTRDLCPACTDVCCRQKHGRYRERDLVYLRALGAIAPVFDHARPSESTCEYLGERGCIHPRWFRPFKCTWYFCEPLIKAMDERPGRATRRLTAVMEEMIRLYDRLEG